MADVDVPTGSAALHAAIVIVLQAKISLKDASRRRRKKPKPPAFGAVLLNCEFQTVAQLQTPMQVERTHTRDTCRQSVFEKGHNLSHENKRNS